MKALLTDMVCVLIALGSYPVSENRFEEKTVRVDLNCNFAIHIFRNGPVKAIGQGQDPGDL